MKKHLRASLALVVVVVAMLAFTAAVAYADPTTSLDFNTSSPGAASWFGGLESTVTWYNQDVSITTVPTLFDFSQDSDISLNYFAYSFNGSAFTSITASPLHTFAAEGLYSFDATGTDDLDTAFEGTQTPGFGIDKTRPTSASNLVPVYDASAKVTITAADMLSGAEFIVYTLDGASDYATPTPTGSLSADVVMTTPGMHTLGWFTVDNAGNHEHAHNVSFLVNATGYVPVLGKPRIKALKKHNAVFSGSVTAATTSRTVTLTVQRLNGKKFRSFKTYTVSAAQYAGSYSLTKNLKKAGTYRVRAAEGSGVSAWSNSVKVK